MQGQPRSATPTAATVTSTTRPRAPSRAQGPSVTPVAWTRPYAANAQQDLLLDHYRPHHAKCVLWVGTPTRLSKPAASLAWQDDSTPTLVHVKPISASLVSPVVAPARPRQPAMFASVVGTPTRLSRPVASYARQDSSIPNRAHATLASASFARLDPIAQTRARQPALLAGAATRQPNQVRPPPCPAQHARRARNPPKDHVNHAESAPTIQKKDKVAAPPATSATYQM